MAKRDWRIVLGRLLAMLMTIAAVLIGIGATKVWFEFREAGKVTVTVINATSQPLRSIAVLDGPSPSKGKSLASLPDADPGKKSQITFHFKYDVGPAWLFAERSNAVVSVPLHVLLADNGPFDYTLVVKPDALHLERYARSKGSSSYDYPLKAPATKESRQ